MDATMNDLQRAAARARPALAVLSTELGEPSPDAARALVVLGQMLDDIEVGRHPLDRPDGVASENGKNRTLSVH